LENRIRIRSFLQTGLFQDHGGGEDAGKGRQKNQQGSNGWKPPPVAPEEGDDQDKQAAYSQELDAYNNMSAANADKVDKMNAQFSKWTYVISGYTADGLLIPRDKLVKAD
jgi:hypothetical protein